MGDVVTYILKSETLITVGRKKIVSRAQTCGPLQRIKPPVNSSNVTSQHLQTNKLSHVHSGHAMACNKCVKWRLQAKSKLRRASATILKISNYGVETRNS